LINFFINIIKVGGLTDGVAESSPTLTVLKLVRLNL